jgi:hypothetical protein
MDTITIEVQHGFAPFIKTLLEQLKGVEKISIKEEIVAYSTKDEPLTTSDMKKVIQESIDGIKNGTHKTYTSEEILKSIIKK